MVYDDLVMIISLMLNSVIISASMSCDVLLNSGIYVCLLFLFPALKVRFVLSLCCTYIVLSFGVFFNDLILIDVLLKA